MPYTQMVDLRFGDLVCYIPNRYILRGLMPPFDHDSALMYVSLDPKRDDLIVIADVSTSHIQLIDSKLGTMWQRCTHLTND